MLIALIDAFRNIFLQNEMGLPVVFLEVAKVVGDDVGVFFSTIALFFPYSFI